MAQCPASCPGAAVGSVSNSCAPPLPALQRGLAGSSGLRRRRRPPWELTLGCSARQRRRCWLATSRLLGSCKRRWAPRPLTLARYRRVEGEAVLWGHCLAGTGLRSTLPEGACLHQFACHRGFCVDDQVQSLKSTHGPPCRPRASARRRWGCTLRWCGHSAPWTCADTRSPSCCQPWRSGAPQRRLSGLCRTPGSWGWARRRRQRSRVLRNAGDRRSGSCGRWWTM